MTSGVQSLGGDTHQRAFPVPKLYADGRVELERRVAVLQPPEHALQGSGGHELAPGGQGEERG